VYSQMVAGKDAPSFGEAKNSWLTGTAAWTFTNISQYILGVYPTLKGLRIDPRIPSDFGDYTVKRIYRGARYTIKIKNPSRVEKGVKSVIVNGEKIDGNVIPPAGVNERVLVEVTMG
ncbi:MAG: glycosyl transferase, partial [Lachnospiraceae bacterium]|nr:glycosyl transferase [Lachnospiraceae bacterium]